MLPLAELLRTAGNTLLRPIDLGSLPDAASWSKALVLGSARQDVIEATAEELRQVAPSLSVDQLAQPRLRAVRRGGYDVVCLLLTGERHTREKLLALRSGAPALLARGARGQWYQINLPRLRPLSWRWWPRLLLVVLLGAVYLWAIEAILLIDALGRLLPMRPPIPDPGPPDGQRTTFIVPTYNQRALMDFCLPPLLAEAAGWHQVTLVDDGSTDGTAEYVKRKYPNVKVVRLPANKGFATAVQAGIAASSTPLFALINNDVQVRPGFLRAILPHFHHADTFAVCARIELSDGTQTETGNVAPSFSGILEPHHVAATGAGPILYAGGASSVFHRRRYQALGGFDLLYHPFYWEDIDLGYRAWRRGWRSLFEPQASVLHQRRATIGSYYGDAYASETFLKNALLFVWKNVRDRDLIAQHLVYVWARLFQEVLSGQGAMCRAAIRSLPSLPLVLLTRYQANRRGHLSDRDILAMASPLATPESAEASR
jgi:GT2 family glycosyltransferase